MSKLIQACRSIESLKWVWPYSLLITGGQLVAVAISVIWVMFIGPAVGAQGITLGIGFFLPPGVYIVFLFWLFARAQ